MFVAHDSTLSLANISKSIPFGFIKVSESVGFNLYTLRSFSPLQRWSCGNHLWFSGCMGWYTFDICDII